MILGRIVTELAGPTTRTYLPGVGFLELTRPDNGQRIRVDVNASEETFRVALPAGRYEVTRVQIAEGPFRSLCDLSLAFEVAPKTVTYVGTWTFRPGTPKYGRMITVSVTEDSEARDLARDLFSEDRQLTEWTSAVSLPVPASVETRLYEVASYPRVDKYFRRHLW